ncbi:MAG: hypothetical protein IPP90_20440 [Gemmatimonadaceae bacterium]|nr:hypothetical protein [Gemmatimonadaceae bacterium]
MGKVGRQLTVSAATASSALTRDVALATVSLATEKALRYRQWVEQQRAYVARISDGRLGYVHMFDMGEPSLDQLYLDLDAENQARDGVVVDVRNNNGGFVNPYAIDVLARRSYLQFTSRGSVPSPPRGNLGQRTIERPTVLVTNQHTLSDGEDFTEGYRTLKLGKVVGEPTAGWIIFTSNVPLLDGTTLRLPSTRVTDAQGEIWSFPPRATDFWCYAPLASPTVVGTGNWMPPCGPCWRRAPGPDSPFISNINWPGRRRRPFASSVPMTSLVSFSKTAFADFGASPCWTRSGYLRRPGGRLTLEQAARS